MVLFLSKFSFPHKKRGKNVWALESDLILILFGGLSDWEESEPLKVKIGGNFWF